MRSLAQDIRNGLKDPRFKYKIKYRLRDTKGGFCAQGTALLSTGFYHTRPEILWPEFFGEQSDGRENLMLEVADKNNLTESTIEEIADWLEQKEWECFGLLTRAMKKELETKNEKVDEVTKLKEVSHE